MFELTEENENLLYSLDSYLKNIPTLESMQTYDEALQLFNKWPGRVNCTSMEQARWFLMYIREKTKTPFSFYMEALALTPPRKRELRRIL